MPNTPLTGIPYPVGSDAPTAAADMMEAFVHLDSRTVLPALDQADRDAKYSSAPASSLVVSGPSKRIWLKTGPNPGDWHDIYFDTGWVENGFTITSGWQVRNKLRARQVTDTIEIRADMVRTGADIQSDETGDIADEQIVAVPPQFRPLLGSYAVGNFRGSRTSGGTTLNGQGNVVLTDMNPGTRIATGDFVLFSFYFFRG